MQEREEGFGDDSIIYIINYKDKAHSLASTHIHTTHNGRHTRTHTHTHTHIYIYKLCWPSYNIFLVLG